MERAEIWLHLTLGGSPGGAKFRHSDIDPAPGEVHGERQPDRPRADDQHLSLDSSVHVAFVNERGTSVSSGANCWDIVVVVKLDVWRTLLLIPA